MLVSSACTAARLPDAEDESSGAVIKEKDIPKIFLSVDWEILITFQLLTVHSHSPF